MIVVALLAALVAIVAAFTARTRPPRAVLGAGALILIGAWIPILLAGTFDPRGDYVGNALGLGLLAWLGSYIGLAVVGAGLLLRLRELMISRQNR
ncbi:hypothetical protein DC522_05005 [Microvirga sp. KLBC 81]|nr:hypothetical protein DC522_05005 [Microvirga sp. KLBC 81]